MFTKFDADKDNESIPSNVKQEYCQTIENVVLCTNNRNTSNTTKPSCSSIQNQYKNIKSDNNYDHYINSPMKTTQLKSTFQIPIVSQQHQQQHLRSPDILSTQTCTEVDLVASSLQNSATLYCDLPPMPSCSKQQQFYTPITNIIKDDTSSILTISNNMKENERAQPDGEELKIHDDLPIKIDIKNVEMIDSSSLTSLPTTLLTTTSSSSITEDQKKSATCDDLDEVMHQISTDLDYLLNGDNELDMLTDKSKENVRQHGNTNDIELIEKPSSSTITVTQLSTCKTNSLRRLSKPHLSIEKIDEEDEEITDSEEIVIKGILRTKC